jgi:hypothetical protein
LKGAQVRELRKDVLLRLGKLSLLRRLLFDERVEGPLLGLVLADEHVRFRDALTLVLPDYRQRAHLVDYVARRRRVHQRDKTAARARDVEVTDDRRNALLGKCRLESSRGQRLAELCRFLLVCGQFRRDAVVLLDDRLNLVVEISNLLGGAWCRVRRGGGHQDRETGRDNGEGGAECHHAPWPAACMG